MIDQKTALELFEYKDGALYKRLKSGRLKLAGSMLNGYTRIGVTLAKRRVEIYAHRLVYLMHHGYLPVEIDHIDGNKANNRIENLRSCTRVQNLHNTPKQVNNTSGIKNVSWCDRNNKWRVTMQVGAKQKYFGLFEDLELAALMASEVRDKYHGEFARHG